MKIFSKIQYNMENDKVIPTVVIKGLDSDESIKGSNIITSTHEVFHGSIFCNLELSEIRNFIHRVSPPYVKRYGGFGIFCSTDFSASCQWAWFRYHYGSLSKGDGLPKEIESNFFINDSIYFPTVYKITLKHGVKFQFKNDDAVCDEFEIEYYKRLGLAGHHSGKTDVFGVSQELCVIDPDAIQSIQNLTISDIEQLDNWDPIYFEIRGKKIDICTKEIYLEWYKEILNIRNPFKK
jgi:hypothetical protein